MKLEIFGKQRTVEPAGGHCNVTLDRCQLSLTGQLVLEGDEEVPCVNRLEQGRGLQSKMKHLSTQRLTYTQIERYLDEREKCRSAKNS